MAQASFNEKEQSKQEIRGLACMGCLPLLFVHARFASCGLFSPVTA
jgi:hypothetical protein